MWALILLIYRITGDNQEAERHLNLDRRQGECSGETRGIHHEKRTIDDLQLVIWDYVSSQVHTSKYIS